MIDAILWGFAIVYVLVASIISHYNTKLFDNGEDVLWGTLDLYFTVAAAILTPAVLLNPASHPAIEAVAIAWLLFSVLNSILHATQKYRRSEE